MSRKKAGFSEVKNLSLPSIRKEEKKYDKQKDLWSYIFYADYYNEMMKKKQHDFNQNERIKKKMGMRSSQKVDRKNSEASSHSSSHVIKPVFPEEVTVLPRSNLGSGLYDGRVIELRKRYVNLWKDIEEMVCTTNGLKQLPPIDLNDLEDFEMDGYGNNKYGHRMHEDEMYLFNNGLTKSSIVKYGPGRADSNPFNLGLKQLGQPGDGTSLDGLQANPGTNPTDRINRGLSGVDANGKPFPANGSLPNLVQGPDGKMIDLNEKNPDGSPKYPNGLIDIQQGPVRKLTKSSTKSSRFMGYRDPEGIKPQDNSPDGMYY